MMVTKRTTQNEVSTRYLADIMQQELKIKTSKTLHTRLWRHGSDRRGGSTGGAQGGGPRGLQRGEGGARAHAASAHTAAAAPAVVLMTLYVII